MRRAEEAGRGCSMAGHVFSEEKGRHIATVFRDQLSERLNSSGVGCRSRTYLPSGLCVPFISPKLSCAVISMRPFYSPRLGVVVIVLCDGLVEVLAPLVLQRIAKCFNRCWFHRIRRLAPLPSDLTQPSKYTKTCFMYGEEHAIRCICIVINPYLFRLISAGGNRWSCSAPVIVPFCGAGKEEGRG